MPKFLTDLPAGKIVICTSDGQVVIDGDDVLSIPTHNDQDCDCCETGCFSGCSTASVYASLSSHSLFVPLGTTAWLAVTPNVYPSTEIIRPHSRGPPILHA